MISTNPKMAQLIITDMLLEQLEKEDGSKTK